MVLFNDIVHIFVRPSFAVFRQQLFFLEIRDGTDVTRVQIHIDDPGCRDIGSTEHLPEEPFEVHGGFSAASNRIEIDAMSFIVGNASLVIDGAVGLTEDLRDSTIDNSFSPIRTDKSLRVKDFPDDITPILMS